MILSLMHILATKPQGVPRPPSVYKQTSKYTNKNSLFFISLPRRSHQDHVAQVLLCVWIHPPLCICRVTNGAQTTVHRIMLF